MTDVQRNSYGSILNPPQFVQTLLMDAERKGCWETGIAADKKNRGSSINIAVYGFNELEQLAVVQVRECQFHPRRFNRVRKDYYLLGRIESGEVFAHAVDSPCRSKLAMSNPQYCVDYVLSKIWQCHIDDIKDIIRQGDVALIPIISIPATATPVEDAVVIRETHKVTGDVFKDTSGVLYCRRGAKITHTKGEHATIKARSGFYRIQPGYRASVWGFSTPTPD